MVLTLEQAAGITPPIQLTDTEALIDLRAMRSYRLERVRAQLRSQDIGACVLLSPYSIRYATGLRNCAIFQTHILAGYLYISQEGPIVYFDSDSGLRTAAGQETVDEIRDDALPLSFMFAGSRLSEWTEKWAAQIADLFRQHNSGNQRLAIERSSPSVPGVFACHGIETLDAADVVEPARSIKCPEEILCMNHAIAVAESGMWRLREQLRPGMTEMELWSLLWQVNIANGGDWIECRLLSAGDRTNPWLQEASSRIIRPNEIVAFDTDMVGPFGYTADISRSIFSGPGRPNDYQRELYQRAHEEVHFNLDLMKPGATFREITEKAFRQPEQFCAQHYPVIAHGVGMSDEWPCIFYQQDEDLICDGTLEPGMTICVESYVGEVGGPEGVKLEEQILITDDGNRVLSKFPFEDIFLT